MRKSRFTDEQVIGFIKQAHAGMSVADLCRREGFSSATFYEWRAKFGGMEASDAKRLRELESENNRLKKLLPAGVVAQLMGHKPSATAEKHYTVRPLDLLRMHHERIEAWMPKETGRLLNSERRALGFASDSCQ